jgi:hypothetical protein
LSLLRNIQIKQEMLSSIDEAIGKMKYSVAIRVPPVLKTLKHPSKARLDFRVFEASNFENNVARVLSAEMLMNGALISPTTLPRPFATNETIPLGTATLDLMLVVGNP